MYLEMMKSFVSGTAFNEAELSVVPSLNYNTLQTKPFDKKLRKGGDDWTFLGDTMTGWARIDNVNKLLTDVVQKGILGDYIETGVWRGGSSVFARAVLTSLGEEKKRRSYVCDSFSGLPPSTLPGDNDHFYWDNTRYLEVPYQ